MAIQASPAQVLDFRILSKKFEQATEGLVFGQPRELLMQAISNMINNDRRLLGEIHKVLLDRLKYSTGRVLHSIRFKCDIVNVQESKLAVSVELDSNDPHLLNALLGEEEQDVNAPLPSLHQMTSWVRSKAEIFRDATADIKKKQEERLRRSALRLQRYALSGELNTKYDNKPLHMPAGKSPEQQLAGIILERMLARKNKGLSPTKGSEYTIVGNYPEYDEGVRGSYSAMYLRYGAPLLTKHSDMGVINNIIFLYLRKEVNKIVNTVIKNIVTKKSESSVPEINAKFIADGMKSAFSKSDFGRIATMVKRAEVVLEKVNAVPDFKSGISLQRKRDAEALLKKAEGVYNKVYLSMFSSELNNISKQIKEISAQLKSAGSQPIYVKKRRATRRRGR